MTMTIFPLTIVKDRYNGVYSGGAFTAWNLQPHSVPDEIGDDDVECACFWGSNKIPVGLGESPSDAIFDLANKLMNSQAQKEDVR